MTDELRRAHEWVRMMNELIRNRTPQERDRLMQQYLAQGQTLKQRARVWCMLMDNHIREMRVRRHGQ